MGRCREAHLILLRLGAEEYHVRDRYRFREAFPRRDLSWAKFTRNKCVCTRAGSRRFIATGTRISATREQAFAILFLEGHHGQKNEDQEAVPAGHLFFRTFQSLRVCIRRTSCKAGRSGAERFQTSIKAHQKEAPLALTASRSEKTAQQANRQFPPSDFFAFPCHSDHSVHSTCAPRCGGMLRNQLMSSTFDPHSLRLWIKHE